MEQLVLNSSKIVNFVLEYVSLLAIIVYRFDIGNVKSDVSPRPIYMHSSVEEQIDSKPYYTVFFNTKSSCVHFRGIYITTILYQET